MEVVSSSLTTAHKEYIYHDSTTQQEQEQEMGIQMIVVV
jgi:hypothetical protein